MISQGCGVVSSYNVWMLLPGAASILGAALGSLSLRLKVGSCSPHLSLIFIGSRGDRSSLLVYVSIKVLQSASITIETIPELFYPILLSLLGGMR